MGLRFQYYDMFLLLNNGHCLIQFNAEQPHYYLDGHLAANILAPHFIENGWVRRVCVEDRDNRIFFTLSKKGEEVFEEGGQWYASLPLWYKILGRFF